MKNRLLRYLQSLLVVVTLSLLSATASGQCVTFPGETPPFLPAENEALLLARALPQQASDSLTVSPYRWGPFGQVVVVEEIVGAGREALDQDSVAVLVRWIGIDDNCDRIPAREPLASGRRRQLTATLRPDSLWLKGHPTFDAYRGLFSDFHRDTAGADPPSFADYRSLMEALPSRTTWANDCRPGVKAVRRWLEDRPQVERYSPFNQVLGRLSEYCLRSLEGHAEELERGDTAVFVPERVRRLAHDQECIDDSTTLMNFSEVIIDGRFVPSKAPQWAFICPRGHDWQLLVAVMESPPRVIELLRMKGHAWNWLVFAAPPEYFDWVCSRDLGAGRYREPYPKRDVVLLWESEVEETRLAFYETPEGWVHVRTRYCENLD